MSAIVAALIGAVAVVAGVYIAESLRRRGDDDKRITALALDVTSNGYDLVVALGPGKPIQPVLLDNFKRLMRDLAEMQVLLLVRRDSVAADAVKLILTDWTDASARLAETGHLTREDQEGLRGALSTLPTVIARTTLPRWKRRRRVPARR